MVVVSSRLHFAKQLWLLAVLPLLAAPCWQGRTDQPSFVEQPSLAHMILATVAAAVLERKWSRAIPGESPPQRLARLADHRAHQSRQKERRVARLDSLLDRAEASAGYPTTVPLCGAARIEWDALPPGCDPCLVSSKMREGTLRGDRKRESVSAMAWLLREALLPLAPSRPTIVDAGCERAFGETKLQQCSV